MRGNRRQTNQNRLKNIIIDLIKNGKYVEGNSYKALSNTLSK